MKDRYGFYEVSSEFIRYGMNSQHDQLLQNLVTLHERLLPNMVQANNDDDHEIQQQENETCKPFDPGLSDPDPGQREQTDYSRYIRDRVCDPAYVSVVVVRTHNPQNKPIFPQPILCGVTMKWHAELSFFDIVFMSTDWDEQQRGYGALALNQCKRLAFQNWSPSCLYLLTQADNEAIGFYRKQGFISLESWSDEFFEKCDLELYTNVTLMGAFTQNVWNPHASLLAMIPVLPVEYLSPILSTLIEQHRLTLPMLEFWNPDQLLGILGDLYSTDCTQSQQYLPNSHHVFNVFQQICDWVVRYLRKRKVRSSLWKYIPNENNGLFNLSIAKPTSDSLDCVVGDDIDCSQNQQFQLTDCSPNHTSPQNPAPNSKKRRLVLTEQADCECSGSIQSEHHQKKISPQTQIHQLQHQPHDIEEHSTLQSQCVRVPSPKKMENGECMDNAENENTSDSAESNEKIRRVNNREEQTESKQFHFDRLCDCLIATHKLNRWVPLRNLKPLWEKNIDHHGTKNFVAAHYKGKDGRSADFGALNHPKENGLFVLHRRKVRDGEPHVFVGLFYSGLR